MPGQKTLSDFFKPLASGGVKRPFSELVNGIENKADTPSSPSSKVRGSANKETPDGKDSTVRYESIWPVSRHSYLKLVLPNNPRGLLRTCQSHRMPRKGCKRTSCWPKSSSNARKLVHFTPILVTLGSLPLSQNSTSLTFLR